jgi:hypothetical protein
LYISPGFFDSWFPHNKVGIFYSVCLFISSARQDVLGSSWNALRQAGMQKNILSSRKRTAGVPASQEIIPLQAVVTGLPTFGSRWSGGTLKSISLLQVFQYLKVLFQIAPAQHQADQIEQHQAKDHGIPGNHVSGGLGGSVL